MYKSRSIATTRILAPPVAHAHDTRNHTSRSCRRKVKHKHANLPKHTDGHQSCLHSGLKHYSSRLLREESKKRQLTCPDRYVPVLVKHRWTGSILLPASSIVTAHKLVAISGTQTTSIINTSRWYYNSKWCPCGQYHTTTTDAQTHRCSWVTLNLNNHLPINTPAQKNKRTDPCKFG